MHPKEVQIDILKDIGSSNKIDNNIQGNHMGPTSKNKQAREDTEQRNKYPGSLGTNN